MTAIRTPEQQLRSKLRTMAAAWKHDADVLKALIATAKKDGLAHVGGRSLESLNGRASALLTLRRELLEALHA